MLSYGGGPGDDDDDSPDGGQSDITNTLKEMGVNTRNHLPGSFPRMSDDPSWSEVEEDGSGEVQPNASPAFQSVGSSAIRQTLQSLGVPRGKV